MVVSCIVQSMVVCGVEIVANAKPTNLSPLTSLATRKGRSKSGRKLSNTRIKKVVKAKSNASVDWMTLNPDILAKIFSFLKTCPYLNCSKKESCLGQYHIIPRTFLSNLRGVCKRIRSLIDEYFPEETLHLILSRNPPSKVYELFESNPGIKLAFDKCIGDCLCSSDATGPKADPDEASDECEEDEWDGDALSDEYIHLALDMCQESVVRSFVQSEAVSEEDVALHIAVIPGEPDEDDRMFLALRSRTIAFKFDDLSDGATGSARCHRIDTRPAPPHAQWLAARILSFLGRAGVDMGELEQGCEGWRLSARARDPADAGLGIRFVAGVCIG